MPNSGTYTVKAGDSLSAIANAHGCDWRELARLNGIADANSIRPGQQLTLPGNGGAEGSQPASADRSASAASPGEDWAALIEAHGDDEAKAEFAAGKRVLIALRTTTNRKANQGRGVYDDQLIVVRKVNGSVSATKFACNTEPSGQYGHGGAKDDTGADINRDGKVDQGRLVAGTYHYVAKPGGHLGGPAFWTRGTQTAERDVNQDGVWNEADGANRIDPTHVGRTMYIHRGGDDNTWSAGCQTIRKSHYGAFMSSLGGQTGFSYILINAS
ncbi:MAG TPA: LysM domain-containing protein [Allosphingosinicella sp.]|nr:LysM domain-containing protein [Allosphingosinicella sp.]